MCYQWDKILHPSQEETYPAISGDYLQRIDHPRALKRELFATLSNATQQDIIEVEGSDSDQPPKLNSSDNFFSATSRTIS